MRYVFLEDGFDFISKTIDELNSQENVRIIYWDRSFNGKLGRMIAKLYLSQRMPKCIHFPFRTTVYRRIIGNEIDSSDLCFVISAGWYKKCLVEILKLYYPKAKKVLFFRDTVHLAINLNREMKPEQLLQEFDAVLSYNPEDALKYGFYYTPMFVSKIPLERIPKKEASDLSLVCVAKDRLSLIYSILHKAKENGIKCDFVVAGTDKEDVLSEDGIEYIDKNLDYLDYLGEEIASNCILEVIKGDSAGNTYRCWEAVYYNKKLLTNWAGIYKFPFYNPKYMKNFTNANDIDYEFIRSKDTVNYGYKDENSPIHMLDTINKVIGERK